MKLFKRLLLHSVFFLPWVAAIHAQTNPIVFVTQVPQPADFTTIGSTFGNHLPSVFSAPRGGDLWIRYPDGALKNLTETAGFGDPGEHQGAAAIAVRDPSVSWDGRTVIFSMIVGAPSRQYDYASFRWQIYEITGLDQEETPIVTILPNQPAGYNNVSPIYGTNGRVIFTTDMPHGGRAHLYPQLDEYEEAPTVSGLWSLDPATGDLFMMEHSPSGSFTPSIDSFGRVIFTRWDHLQRDQQADGDALSGTPGGIYGTFDYSSESPDAERLFGTRIEYFPEPRPARADLLDGSNLNGIRFNHFFPWMIEEDGTEMETLNHVGRHELHAYFNVAVNDDPALGEFIAPDGRTNPNAIENLFQIKEDPATPGLYIGVDAPEFATHAAGMIVSLTGAPADNPDDMIVRFLTHPDTQDATDTPSPDHSGLYRDPLPTSDGLLIASHTSETRADNNEGSGSNYISRYDFRLRVLGASGNGYLAPVRDLTGGIHAAHTWWSPDFLVTFGGDLWELQPVELRPRTIPSRAPIVLPAIEEQLIVDEGESLANLRSYLRSQDLALVVMRDITTRDDADEQQPYWLRVFGDTAPVPEAGSDKVYDVKYLQFFQADLLRSLQMHTPDDASVRQGRRVLARPMHAGSTLNQTDSGAPDGSVLIAADGSAVAVVPARRALTWQLTDERGEGVVRERYWLSFQPGEVRSCTSCHGLNRTDHKGATKPLNPPQALTEFLEAWIDQPPVDAELIVLTHPQGGYELHIHGDIGQEVVLERSTDLVHWEAIDTVVLTDGSIVYPIAPTVTSGPRSFFRLVRL